MERLVTMETSVAWVVSVLRGCVRAVSPWTALPQEISAMLACVTPRAVRASPKQSPMVRLAKMVPFVALPIAVRPVFVLRVCRATAALLAVHVRTGVPVMRMQINALAVHR